MSRAFVREQDTDHLDDLPESADPEHPNDVTETGLAQIEHALASRRRSLRPCAGHRRSRRARGRATGPSLLDRAARDRARGPRPFGLSEVRFGASVTILRDDGRSRRSGSSARTRPIPPRARSPMSRRWRGRCSASASATSSLPAPAKPRSSASSDVSRSKMPGRVQGSVAICPVLDTSRRTTSSGSRPRAHLVSIYFKARDANLKRSSPFTTRIPAEADLERDRVRAWLRRRLSPRSLAPSE